MTTTGPTNGNGQSRSIEKKEPAAVVVGPAARYANIEKEILKAKTSMLEMLPKHVAPDRMMRAIFNALKTTPELLACEPRSVVTSAAQLCAIGLEPNSPMSLAYLVPFKNTKKNRTDCQSIIGYRGYLRLAFNSGELSDIYAECVYKNDIFERTLGTDRKLHHIPFEGDDRGALTGVYAVAVMKSGFKTFTYLPKGEVEKIKKMSQVQGDGPWNTWEDQMWQKTAIRRLSKYMPLSEEKGAAFYQAVAHEEKQMAGEPDFGSVIDMPADEQDVSRTDDLADRLEQKAAS
jgi:recombination protein RecT